MFPDVWPDNGRFACGVGHAQRHCVVGGQRPSKVGPQAGATGVAAPEVEELAVALVLPATVVLAVRVSRT